MENKINNIQNKESEGREREDLKSKVLEQIERDKIKPTTKLYFTIKDSTFWAFFVASVLVGATAFSVMIFSFTNSGSELYEMTHDSILDFLLDMTPYLWILLFVAFAFVAYENFKHTNKGYKYSFTIVLVSGLVLNILGGFTLYYLGVSKIIDQDISPNLMFVRSSEISREMIWNKPDRGILAGDIVSLNSKNSTFVLKDFNGNLWTVSSDYVPDVSLYLISTSSEIRVVGIRQNVYFPVSTSSGAISSSSPINNVTANPNPSTTSTSPYMGSVVACYILPWNSDDYTSGISKIKGSMVNASDAERNISDTRNNKCKAIKPYNIIRKTVEN